jgi:chromosome segregation ATPase
MLRSSASPADTHASPQLTLPSLHTRFTTVLQQAISFAHSSSLHTSPELSEVGLDTQKEALENLEREVAQWERLVVYTEAVEDQAYTGQKKGDWGKAEIRPTDFQRLSKLIAEAQNRVIALIRRKEGNVEGQVWEVFMTLVQRLYSAFFSVIDDGRSGKSKRMMETEGDLSLKRASDPNSPLSRYSLREEESSISPRQLGHLLPLNKQRSSAQSRLQSLEQEKDRLSALICDLESALNQTRAEAQTQAEAFASSQATLQQLNSQRALEQEHMAELKRENNLLSEALQALKDSQESLGQAEEQSQKLKRTLDEELKARQGLESRLRLSEQHCTELLERYKEVNRDQRISSLAEQLKKLNAKYEQVSTELADKLEEINQLRIQIDTYERQTEMAGTKLCEAEVAKQQLAVVCQLIGVEHCQAVPVALAQLQQAMKAQDEQASDLLQALEAAEVGAVRLVQERSTLAQQLHESRMTRAAAEDLVNYLRQDIKEKDNQIAHLSILLTQKVTSVEAKDKLCRQLETELQITESLYADVESENVRITEELRPLLLTLQPGLEAAAMSVYRTIATRLMLLETRLQQLVLHTASKVASRRDNISSIEVLFHKQETTFQHCLTAISSHLESLRSRTDIFYSDSILKLAQSNRLLKAQCESQAESLSRLQAQVITQKAVQSQSVSSFVTDVQSSLRTKQKALVQRLQKLESRLSTGGLGRTDKGRSTGLFESAGSCSPAETNESPLFMSLGGRTSPLPSKSWLL